MKVTTLQFVKDVPLLVINEEVIAFAAVLVRDRVMPTPVAGDAIHVAVATAHRVQYLLTWNVRHLANPRKLAHLQAICGRAGYLPPQIVQIVTPDLLWESPDESPAP